MICSHPITIKNTRGEYIDVPCGQCLACRLNFSRDWATRIMSEARLHESNVFVTLTYDEEHLPENGSLVKRHVQNFMKSLRKAIVPRKVRFFMSGEYGDTFHRPHYHLIIFGLGIFDNVFKEHMYDKSHNGYCCRCSVWNKGNVYLGNVTVDSARYVAKYAVKKLKGQKSNEYYESLGIIPEFSLMSRRPGIGADFCDKYADELKEFGNIPQKGVLTPLPRYFKQRVDFSPHYKDVIKAQKKLDSFLGDKPFEHMTYHEWYDYRGDQQEKNIKGAMRK